MTRFDVSVQATVVDRDRVDLELEFDTPPAIIAGSTLSLTGEHTTQVEADTPVEALVEALRRIVEHMGAT